MSRTAGPITLVNPVIGTVGDKDKSVKYQSVPGID